MRRVLLAWEIGGSFGHVARLIPLARCLQQLGHHVEAAVRDPGALAVASTASPLAGLTAPHIPPVISRRPLSLNYADLLMRNGYGDSAAVSTLIEQWLALFDNVRPDLVVLEHAPGALLAAMIANRRRIVIGSGFSVPPTTAPQPPIQPWFDVPAELLVRREGMLLAAVNPVLTRFGGRSLVNVAEIFGGAERLVCTFPDLDHYQRRESDSYTGPFGATDGDDAPWPDGDGPRVFFYGRSRRVLDVLDVAIARNCRSVIYHPSSSDSPSGLHPAVNWLSRPADLDRIASVCNLVVCEAPGTATRFLLAGVPALLLPRQLEQELWAYRVTARGLARAVSMFSGGSLDHLAAAFDDALTSVTLRARVEAFASAHAPVDAKAALARLANRCETLLA